MRAPLRAPFRRSLELVTALAVAALAVGAFGPPALAQPTEARYEAVLAADIRPGGDSNPRYLTVYDGRLFFTATDGQSGRELWVYDATTDEATLVADIYPGGSSDPHFLTVYDGRLFFIATDGQSGRELWVYDATTDEATLVSDIYPGPEDAFGRGLGIWYGFVVYDGRLFFPARGPTEGIELYAYDAATDEATLVADINTCPTPPCFGSSLPSDLTVYDGRLFFQGWDGPEDPNGRELWAYDATTDEATLVADVTPGENEDSVPGHLEVYDDRLYFSQWGFGNYGLWSYDAATDEAALIASLEYHARGLTVFESKLFFQGGGQSFRGGDESTNGLWVYDAATGEASLAARFAPRPDPPEIGVVPSPFGLTVYDDHLFFGAWDPQGGTDTPGLWVYDAATGEALLAADVSPSHPLNDGGFGFAWGLDWPGELAVYDSRLFVAATDGQSGIELWTVSPAAVDTEAPAAPERLTLSAPAPNPASGPIALAYTLSEPVPVRLAVYDVLGREVAVLAEGTQAAGQHEVAFDTRHLTPGLYVVRLTAGSDMVTRRLTVVR